MLPVVDRSRTGRYAPRPLCQNLGAKPGTVSCFGVSLDGFALSAREAWQPSLRAGFAALRAGIAALLSGTGRPRRSRNLSSSARGADTELGNGLRSRVPEFPRLSRLANVATSSPTEAARFGHEEPAALRAARVASHPHPTLIPIPRLRSFGPLSLSPSRTSILEVAAARSAGGPALAFALERRAELDGRSLRLHGRSDNPCS